MLQRIKLVIAEFIESNRGINMWNFFFALEAKGFKGVSSSERFAFYKVRTL